MSGSDRQPHQRQPGRPATVTIKTVIERRFPPSDHMLAEHNLQRAPCFRRTRGHIPSSQLFEIDAVRCAKAPAEANSNSLFPDLLVRPSSRRALRHVQRDHGGDGRDRTDDLMLAKQLLSQLSYVPLIMVGLGRLERPTSPLSGVRSNHLSYRPRAGRLSHGRCLTQQALSEPAIRMRKRNEDGFFASRQMKS